MSGITPGIESLGTSGGSIVNDGVTVIVPEPELESDGKLLSDATGLLEWVEWVLCVTCVE